MKHNLEHYVSKFLGAVWLVTLVLASVALLAWLVKTLMSVLGVI